jgi:hypothetical protein
MAVFVQTKLKIYFRELTTKQLRKTRENLKRGFPFILHFSLDENKFKE